MTEEWYPPWPKTLLDLLTANGWEAAVWFGHESMESDVLSQRLWVEPSERRGVETWFYSVWPAINEQTVLVFANAREVEDWLSRYIAAAPACG